MILTNPCRTLNHKNRISDELVLAFTDVQNSDNTLPSNLDQDIGHCSKLDESIINSITFAEEEYTTRKSFVNLMFRGQKNMKH